MARFSLSLLIGVAAAIAAPLAGASALGDGPEFSAEQVQIAPDGTRTVVQRMYVGATKLRMEQLAGAHGAVMIADVESGKGWRLIPEQKLYMEMPLPPRMAPPRGGMPQDPCAALPGLQCTKQGEETVNGRVTEKWEISGDHPQQGRVSAVQWIDKERRIPVRNQMPNGALFESRMVGNETINGRTAEKWESTAREGEQVQRSHFWFDPELNLKVREQFPGGGALEMSAIQVAPQPAALFELPADYRAAPMPQMPMHQGGGYPQR